MVTRADHLVTDQSFRGSRTSQRQDGQEASRVEIDLMASEVASQVDALGLQHQRLAEEARRHAMTACRCNAMLNTRSSSCRKDGLKSVVGIVAVPHGEWGLKLKSPPCKRTRICQPLMMEEKQQDSEERASIVPVPGYCKATTEYVVNQRLSTVLRKRIDCKE
jgi:hypothetical protein